METQTHDITRLLVNWRRGDQAALDLLIPLIRRELDRIARRHLGRERKGNSIQPSSLVQEAFLRLLPARETNWRDRTHFFAVASTVMRHVLVDHARAKSRTKRGGRAVHIPLDDTLALSPDRIDQVLAIDLALERLAAKDERKSKVLEMRFFAGLTTEETAEALGIAPQTVMRDWKFASAWMRRELGGEGVENRGALATD